MASIWRHTVKEESGILRNLYFITYINLSEACIQYSR